MIVKKHLILPYTAAQMFDLVNAIEEYPTFLPYCQEAIVYTRSDEAIKAKICLAKGGVQYAFTTLNRLQKNQKIEMNLIEGPFKTLSGIWQFSDLATGGVSIQLDLNFSFSSKLLNLSMSPFVPLISHRLIEAFTMRASDLYAD